MRVLLVKKMGSHPLLRIGRLRQRPGIRWKGQGKNGQGKRQ